MAHLPQFENYGNYASSNYGAHSLRFFDTAGNCYWFSYSTLVAFSMPGSGTVVHENKWGPTTGRHLNWIDGGNKKSRLNHAAFLSVFKDFFGKELAS